MKMFYTPRELFKDPQFGTSVFISIFGAIVIIIGGAFLINYNKITITPLAELKVAPHQAKMSVINVMPITSLLNLVSIGTDAEKNPTVYGYLVDLSEECAKLRHAVVSGVSSDLLDTRAQIEPKIVLVRTDSQHNAGAAVSYMAGTAIINNKTCNIVKHLKDKTVYLAYDREVPSSGPKKFLTVEALISAR